MIGRDEGLWYGRRADGNTAKEQGSDCSTRYLIKSPGVRLSKEGMLGNAFPFEKRAKRLADKTEKNWFLGDKRFHASFFRF